MEQTTTTTIDLSEMTGPERQVVWPEDCPGFGQELPREWRCPGTCPLTKRCYEDYERRSKRNDQ